MEEITFGAQTFVVGAGFSKAISEKMPIMNELGASVLNNFKTQSENEYSNLPDKNDLELALTYLAESQPWLIEEENLRNRADFLGLSNSIRRIITGFQQEALGEIKGFASEHWSIKLIKYLHQRQANVISLNYDVLIEMLFDLTGIGPTNSAAYRIIYPADIPPITARPGSGRIESAFFLSPPETLTLYKLHGSINWLYSGAENFFGEQIYDGGIHFLETMDFSEKNIKVLKRRERSAGDKVPFIVPPTVHKETFFKNEFIRNIWNNAWRELSFCEEIYFLGYSFPKSDLMIRNFFKTFNAFGLKKIYVVNKQENSSEREELIKNYSEGLEKYRNKINFDFVKPGEPIVEFLTEVLKSH